MAEYDFNFIKSGYVAGESFDFNFGVETYTILKGLTDNFLAIWADSDAGLENGKMYVSSAAAFSIVDLGDKKVKDYYTQTHIGRANAALNAEDIVDLGVK